MFEIGTLPDHFLYIGIFALLVLGCGWFLAKMGVIHTSNPQFFSGIKA
jgi:hypothetical protein